MALLRCPCGMQFSLDSYPASGVVFCPGCGRQHALPNSQTQPLSNPQAVTVPAAPPRYQPLSTASAASRQSGQANAVLGFILSLMSFFTCLLLAPLAVYFSFKGLRERDGQGFAIAGLIVGIFQSISLVVLIAYFVFMAIMIGGAGAALAAILAQLGLSAARTAEARLETLAAIQEARVVIQEYYEDHSEWPTESQGTQMIREHHDAWGRSLRYEPAARNQLAIVSAGQDGRFGSPDDISERWQQESVGDAASIVQTPDVPARPVSARDSIASVSEALAQLRSSSYPDRDAGLRWLQAAEVDQDQRSSVIATVLPLLVDPACGDKAGDVVEKWARAEDAALLVAEAARIDRRVGHRAGQRLVRLLIQIDAEAEVLSLLNHPHDEIQREVWNWVQRERIGVPQLVEQCVRDLSEPSRRLAALSRLEELTVDEPLREQVSIAVDPLLSSPDRAVARKALEVITAWGPTSHNLDTLITLRATEQIARVRDPRALGHLGEMLNEWPIKFNEAARELRRIGPAGESCVWPVLKNDNHVVASAAIRLLGEIGTRQSLPHLEKLRDHRLLQPHVVQAIRAIEAAGREPAKWSAEE